MVLFANQAHPRCPVERVQSGVDLCARRVGELGAQEGEADPSAGPGRERGVSVADAVLDRCRGWHVVRVTEHVGEAEVGVSEVAVESGQHGVEGFRRTCRSRRRSGGDDLAAQMPAPVGELMHESPAAANRFDQPKLVEFVASRLVELRPERQEVGVGHRPRLGHQDKKDSSLSAGQIARSHAHDCQRSGWR